MSILFAVYLLYPEHNITTILITDAIISIFLICFHDFKNFLRTKSQK